VWCVRCSKGWDAPSYEFWVDLFLCLLSGVPWTGTAVHEAAEGAAPVVTVR